MSKRQVVLIPGGVIPPSSRTRICVGGRSSPAVHAQAQRLAAIFPGARIERYAQRHHFDPPHRVEAQRLAAQLHELWDRAEAREP